MATENLNYKFTAETQQFQSGLGGMVDKMARFRTESGQAERSAVEFSQKFETAGKKISEMNGLFGALGNAVSKVSGLFKQVLFPAGLVGAGSSAGLIAFTFASMKAYDALNKLASASTLSRNALRQYSVIIGGTSLKIEDISGAAEKLNARIRDVSKPTDDAAVNMNFLGLNMEKLKRASPEEKLRLVSEAILALKDNATASKISQEELGLSLDKLREAADDNGKIKQLSDAQKELVKTQEEAAAGFEKLSKASDDFKRATDDAGAGAQSLATKIVAELLPVFDWVVEKAANAVRAISNMFAAANAGFADFAAKVGSYAKPLIQEGVTQIGEGVEYLKGKTKTMLEVNGVNTRGYLDPAPKEEAPKNVPSPTSFITAELSKQLVTQNQLNSSNEKATQLKNKEANAEAARYKGLQEKAAAERAAANKKPKKEGKSDEEKELERLKAEAEALNDLYLPMEKLNKETAKFNDLFAKGLISAGVRDQAIAKATEDAEKRMKELNKSTDMAGKFMDDLKDKAKSMGDTLVDSFVDGKKSFADMIGQIGKDIAKLALKNAISPLMDSITGGKGKMSGGMGKAGGGAGLPSIPGSASSFLGGIGKRASGGEASGLTLVGERGPELAMFGAGGSVTNAADTQRMLNQGAGNTSVSNITVNVPQGTTPDQGAKIAKYMDQALEARIRKSQVDQRRATPLRG